MRVIKGLMLVVASLQLVNQSVVPIMAQNQETTSQTEVVLTKVNSEDYLPYLAYERYEYKGEGMEFAGFRAQRHFKMNDEGVYQFSRATDGTTVTYVYQMTDDGLYELSYFPETYEVSDYRQHADTLDEYRSLVMPKELVVGESFNSGYRQEMKIIVEDILSEYELNNQTYHNVVVLLVPSDDGMSEDRLYYAPKIGLIYQEFKLLEDNYLVTSTLEKTCE